MNRQRTVILSVAVAAVVLMSAWMIYSEIQTARTTFMTGLPPEEIKKALQPRTVELSQLRPPALRAMDPIRYGSTTSVASVVEYGDYECEACHELKRTIETVLPTLGGRVRLIWRDLPVRDVNPNAFEAAVFARCAGVQGKFWNAHDALFNAPTLGERAYADIAANLGLNTTALATCRADQSVRNALQFDVDVARNDGIGSVPLLFIGTKALQGNISAAELEQEIKRFIAS